MKCILAAMVIETVMASGQFPVVAIMSQPTESNATNCGGTCEYIAASYVKFLELAGARALPVSYYSTAEEIDDIMTQVNGFLFPGGKSDLPAAAQHVVDNALNISSHGGYFPVYGACLGYEWIMMSIGGKDALDASDLDAENMTLPLNFTSDAEDSRLYADAAARKIFAEEPVTLNNHQGGVTPAEFAANERLKSTVRVLSTNMDRKGAEFISSVEGITAPIYAVQYHPEKNIFEWGTYDSGAPYDVINHSPHAVIAAQSLANFFVAETRKNANAYDLSQSRPFFEDLPTDTDKEPKFVEVYYLFPVRGDVLI
jgi:gamma-glutamyl hydrolase